MTAICKNSILIVTTSNASFPLLWANPGCSNPNGTVQDSLPFLFRLVLPFQLSLEACNETRPSALGMSDPIWGPLIHIFVDEKKKCGD